MEMQQPAGAVNAPRKDLKSRQLTPEWMDDPRLEEDLHFAALAGLRRVNRLSRSSSILWPRLKQLATASQRPLRVLDIASGGGDVVAALSRKAHQEGFNLQIDGCDVSERAIHYAQEFARRHSPAPNRFLKLNALEDELPRDYDVLTSSLFLHHLSREDALSLLIRMKEACGQAILINDLRRTRLGYWLAVVGTRALSRSPVVHRDGPLSVRAAWSDPEVQALAEEAGLENAQITHHWPQRFLLTWRKP